MVPLTRYHIDTLVKCGRCCAPKSMPSSKKNAAVPAADAGQTGTPAASPLSGIGRQMVLLPAIWASHKVDWTKPSNQNMLMGAFGIVVLLGFALLQFTLLKINKAKDTRRLANPGEVVMLTKSEDGSVSIQEYDLAKVKELKMQFMMSVGLVAFLHAK